MKEKIKFVVTGENFLNKGIASQERIVKDIINNTQKNLIIFTFSIGGIGDIFDLLKTKIRQGITLNFIYDKGSNPRPQLLNKLKELYLEKPENVNIFGYVDEELDPRKRKLFHAKMLISDRSSAIIGSANFSANGYLFNHEIGVYLEGDIILPILSMIDKFFTECQNLEFLDFYNL